MQRLFDVKSTQLEMMVDRGYELPAAEVNIPNMTLAEFTVYSEGIRNKNAKSVWVEYTNVYINRNTGRTILVFYAAKEDAKKQIVQDTIRLYMKTLTETGVHEGIIIANSNIATDSYKHLLTDLPREKRQIFYDYDANHELTYNPTKHVLVPKHEILSSEDASLLLRELKVDKRNIPIIKADDRIVRHYGWSPCDIVRIIRYDPSVSILTPYSINYRVIIE